MEYSNIPGREDIMKTCHLLDYGKCRIQWPLKVSGYLVLNFQFWAFFLFFICLPFVGLCLILTLTCLIDLWVLPFVNKLFNILCIWCLHLGTNPRFKCFCARTVTLVKLKNTAFEHGRSQQYVVFFTPHVWILKKKILQNWVFIHFFSQNFPEAHRKKKSSPCG